MLIPVSLLIHKTELSTGANGQLYINAFDMLKAFSLGASACYSARGMMFAIGCIQALICDSGKCPVGVATQNPALYKGLDPADKAARTFNFHLNTIKATRELMEACGFADIKRISPAKFFRRINEQTILSFEEIYFAKKKVEARHNFKIRHYASFE